VIHPNFEIQKFDRDCQFYFLPTVWYEYDSFGHITWHSLCFAFLNVILKLDLELH